MTVEWKAPAGGLWELETTHVRGGQPRVFHERAIDVATTKEAVAVRHAAR